MSILTSKSGLIQTVKPSVWIVSGQTYDYGLSTVSQNLQTAKPDPNASSAAGAAYDGFTVFGLFIADLALDGEIT